jgi:acyl-CoA synthetase (NDP forming)
MSQQLEALKEIAESVIEGVLVENRKDLTLPEAMMVLDAYGISVARYSYARDLEEALTAAHGMGYPVSMRLLSKDLLHKPDIGSVFAEVKDADELTSDFLTLLSRAQRHQLNLDGILVQEITGVGNQFSLSVINDPESRKSLLISDAGRSGIVNTVSCALPLAEVKAGENHSDLSTIEINEALRETVGRLTQLAADFPLIKQILIDRFVICHEPDSIKIVNVQIGLR